MSLINHSFGDGPLTHWFSSQTSPTHIVTAHATMRLTIGTRMGERLKDSDVCGTDFELIWWN